ERGTELLRVLDAESNRIALEATGIADLPAALGVERGAVEDDRAACAFLQPLDGMALVVVQRADLAVELECLVTVKLGRLIEARHCAGACTEAAHAPRTLALLIHIAIEARAVD